MTGVQTCALPIWRQSNIVLLRGFQSLAKGEEKDNTVSLDKRTKLMTYSEDWPFKESDIPVFPGSHLHGYVDIKTGDTTLVIYNTTKEEFAQYKITCLKARKKDALIPEMVEDRLVIADKKAGRLFIISRDEKNATTTRADRKSTRLNSSH